MFTYKRNFRLLSKILWHAGKPQKICLWHGILLFGKKIRAKGNCLISMVYRPLARGSFFDCSVTRGDRVWHFGTYYVGSLPCQRKLWLRTA